MMNRSGMVSDKFAPHPDFSTMSMSADPAAPELTHYEMLGVPPHATPGEIRLAYRRAIRVCHPDHTGNDPQAAALFRSLTSAYRILRDPKARMALDARLGFGMGVRPWYYDSTRPSSPDPGPRERAGSALIRSHTSNASELVAQGMRTSEVAARLIEEGCPYEHAWKLAWEAQNSAMHERMQRRHAGAPMADGFVDVVKGAWQPYRESFWMRIRHALSRCFH